MARKRETKTEARNAGLEQPFPQAPNRPARHVIYATRQDNAERGCVMTFRADYAAKHFLDVLIGSDEWEEVKSPVEGSLQILTDSGVLIRASTLDRLLNYELTDAEREWELPSTYEREASQVRVAFVRRERRSDDEETSTDEAPKPKREKKAKVDRSSKVTIQAVAEELGMTPKEARTILRKLKIEKPDGGWLFDSADVPALKEKLQKNRK